MSQNTNSYDFPSFLHPASILLENSMQIMSNENVFVLTFPLMAFIKFVYEKR